MGQRRFCLLALLLGIFISLGCSNPEARVVPFRAEEPSVEELRQAMRYHGVLFAEQDESGEWYFRREGKRCRLFAYQKYQTAQL